MTRAWKHIADGVVHDVTELLRLNKGEARRFALSCTYSRVSTVSYVEAVTNCVSCLSMRRSSVEHITPYTEVSFPKVAVGNGESFEITTSTCITED